MSEKKAILCRINKGRLKFSRTSTDIFRYGKDVQSGYYAGRNLIKSGY